MEHVEIQLQQLLDKEAIRNVRNQFAEALDNKDWTLFESLFAEQVETDFTAWGLPAQQMTSHGLTALFSQNTFRKAELVTQHLYSNFRITVDRSKAVCVSNFLGQHYIADLAGENEFYLRGEYTDQLIKTVNGWKIYALKLRIFYTSGNAAVLA